MDAEQQIDELQVAVFGRDDQQELGLKRRVNTVEKELAGSGSELGLKQKVNVMWRLHVWILCSFSGIAGSLLTLMIQKFRHP